MDRLYLEQKFFETFGRRPEAFASAPGRVELLGNHVDHQNGKVLAASVNLKICAVYARRTDKKIDICSEGSGRITIDAEELSPVISELHTSRALVRGIVCGFLTKSGAKELSFGFDAYIKTEVLMGSGLSSSAAFEVLIGRIFNQLYVPKTAKQALSATDIAVIGQFAENKYFGKPCGLMDQMACSVGKIVFIDFKYAETPLVEQIAFDFEKAGYALLAIDSGASHDNLTEEYAQIPADMKQAAQYFGKNVLREVDPALFTPDLSLFIGERPLRRAKHFYAEMNRVDEAMRALKENNLPAFLWNVNASGISSRDVLENVVPASDPSNTKLLDAMEYVRGLLKGDGAVRINGGGFAGTLIAFVPLKDLDTFRKAAEKKLGEGSCHYLHIEN